MKLSICVPTRDAVNTSFAHSLALLTARFYGDAPAGTTYAWFFRGGEFCNTTDPVLSLHNVTAAYAGDYTCVATNAFGSTKSSAATLTLNFSEPKIQSTAMESRPETSPRVVSVARRIQLERSQFDQQ